MPPPSAFLEAIISLLMPYFIDAAADIAAARSEIIETLASYATRTRSEMLQAAQIIAFAMSTLDTLAEAKATELSPSLRIRSRGCANNLNRSARQQQDALDRRLACDRPHRQEPMVKSSNDLPDAEVDDGIGKARAAIEAHRIRFAGTRSAIGSADAVAVQERHSRIWAGAMMESLNQMRLGNESARRG